jgi:type VI secretion system secreted protein VgrG
VPLDEPSRDATARILPVDCAFRMVEGADPDARVRAWELVEAFGRPYELRLDLLAPDLDFDVDALVGCGCEVSIERGELVRVVTGLVVETEYMRPTSDGLAMRVCVQPAFGLLAHEVDTRIFQGLTVVEVLREVLEPALEAYGRKVDLESGLAETYATRDYCVQYHESTLDFVCRLMQEEGIAWHFVHDDESGCEKLVLFDHNDACPEVELVVGGEVPIAPHHQDTLDRESITELDWRRIRRTDHFASRGYNWKTSTSMDEAEEDAADEAPQGRSLARYDHDDRRRIEDDLDDPGFDGSAPQRATMAAIRMQATAAQMRLARGRSNVAGLAVGFVFTLGEHPRADLDGQRFLVTRVRHVGQCADQEAGATSDERYSNAFECIPADRRYCPPRTLKRPRVLGPQTAIVTGPSGEEIHTDAHGRIKVHFPWDRLNPADDCASCWLRVAQSWAGRGFGTWFLPRVGMEVVVEFLEGNPDRPLVTGCVYNPDTALPYPLPDEKTKSTIKTQSSPGGEGFNELRFEDAKDAEEIWIHAQKDLNVKVLNNESTSVDIDQSLQVGGNQTIVVKGNQTITVKGDPDQPKGGGGGGGGGGFKGSSTDVTGDYKVTASATAYISAPDSITLECPGSSIKLEPGKITLTAGGGATIVLDANALMQSAAGSKVFLDGNALTQSSGGSKVLLDGNANMQSSGGSQVLLDGNALVAAAAGANAMFDANATITGATSTVGSTSGGFVELTANADLGGATVTCASTGGGSVTLTANAEIAGAEVSSTASGTNAVKGATVALN